MTGKTLSKTPILLVVYSLRLLDALWNGDDYFIAEARGNIQESIKFMEKDKKHWKELEQWEKAALAILENSDKKMTSSDYKVLILWKLGAPYPFKL